MLCLYVLPLFWTMLEGSTELLMRDFKVRNGLKLVTVYKTLTAISKIKCSNLCNVDTLCASVSFR